MELAAHRWLKRDDPRQPVAWGGRAHGASALESALAPLGPGPLRGSAGDVDMTTAPSL